METDESSLNADFYDEGHRLAADGLRNLIILTMLNYSPNDYNNTMAAWRHIGDRVNWRGEPRIIISDCALWQYFKARTPLVPLPL